MFFCIAIKRQLLYNKCKRKERLDMASVMKKVNHNGTVSYIIRVYLCRDAKGRAKYLSKTYTPLVPMSQAKIDKQIKEIIRELEDKAQSGYSSDAKQKFEAYAEHFLAVKSRSCQDYTIRTYRNELKTINQVIGQIPLEKLSVKDLDHFYFEISNLITQHGRAYSSTYIHHCCTLIRMVLGLAVKEEVLQKNVADKEHFTPPRAVRKDPEFLEPEEAKEFVRCALQEEDLRIRLMVMLYLYTGIRMEELCGLEWKDINFETREIRIERASIYIPGQRLITKETKNASSRRIIKADPLVFTVLAEYKDKYREKQAAKNGSWINSDRLFVRSDGNPITPNMTALWLDKFTKKYGLRRVTPHKLRHTYATLQIAYDTDIRTVAGVMGHSSPITTLTIYAHQVKEASEKASRAMTEMLTPRKPGEEQQ